MSKKQQASDNLENFIIGIFIVLGILGKFAVTGLKQINLKSIDWICFLVLLSLISATPPFWKPYQVFGTYWDDFILYFLLVHFIVFTVIGLIPSIKFMRLQNNLNFCGLKNTNGQKPKLYRVIKLDDFRTKLLVIAKGIGPARFETKKGDLEGSFQQKVEKIDFSKDKKFIEIYLCQKDLPTMIPYSEVSDKAMKENTFLLGESQANGFLTEDITSLPHLLIGGSTGGGKSSFFKGTVLNLLKTTPHLQMFLIDLKKGVEVQEFADLPNVTIAKDEYEAVKVLQVLKNEMDKRYDYLQKRKGRKIIIPKKDNKDRIILAIDEASVLYGKTSTNKARKELVQKARELTDDLAKLARAAGIHLIIATQKPIKDSIDTKTLENLPGRISFRMSSHAGSNSMLGNGKAYSLPEINGRAIWKGGNKFIEIQTPYITEEEIEHEIEEVKAGFEDGKYKNLQPILSTTKTNEKLDIVFDSYLNSQEDKN